MSKKLQYLIGIVLLLTVMPIRGISQTGDDTKADKVERAHRAHVVKKAWNGTKRDVKTGTRATAHATGKAWSGTKHAVSTGAHATAHEAGKVWKGTKRVTRTVVRAPGKAIHNAKVEHQEREKQEGETK